MGKPRCRQGAEPEEKISENWTFCFRFVMILLRGRKKRAGLGIEVSAMDVRRAEEIVRDFHARGYYPAAVRQVFNARETLGRFAVGEAAWIRGSTWLPRARSFCANDALFPHGRRPPFLDDLALPYLDGGRGHEAAAQKRDLAPAAHSTPPHRRLGYPFYADGRPFFTALEHVLRHHAGGTGHGA